MERALACSADGDAPALRESAHKLFGIVATVSRRAGALASRLEDEAEQGDLDAAAASARGLSSLVREILSHMQGVSLGALGYSTSSDTTRA
jgi:signal transduction histidine kinase